MAGDFYYNKIKARWALAVQGTTTATASKAGVVGVQYVVTGISGGSDAATIVKVESPAGTIIWQGRTAASGSYTFSFAPGTLIAAAGDLVRVITVTGTAACEANISGFSI